MSDVRKARVPHITHERLPISALFIDEVKESIFVDTAFPLGRRVVHTNGDGYQRDPYRRKKWLEKKTATFKRALFRELEVSAREISGKMFYAVMDGGGRWLMAQQIDLSEVDCRVHHNLSRQEEARLFYEFDKFMVGVHAVDSFLALLSAGDHSSKLIAKAIQPYEVGTKSPKRLFNVGTLKALYYKADKPGPGLKLMGRTALACWNTWGPGNGKAKGLVVPGNMFSAVALLFEHTPKNFDEGVLREIMLDPEYTPEGLKFAVQRATPGLNVATTGIESAVILARRYNRKKTAKSDSFDLKAIRTGDLAAAYQNRFQFPETDAEAA